MESDSCVFLWPVAVTLCSEGGGFQLARDDPSFEFCVWCFAFVGSACVFASVFGVASPVVVLFVLVQLDSTLHLSK